MEPVSKPASGPQMCCLHLRWKGMYVDVEPDPSIQHARWPVLVQPHHDLPRTGWPGRHRSPLLRRARVLQPGLTLTLWPPLSRLAHAFHGAQLGRPGAARASAARSWATSNAEVFPWSMSQKERRRLRRLGPGDGRGSPSLLPDRYRVDPSVLMTGDSPQAGSSSRRANPPWPPAGSARSDVSYPQLPSSSQFPQGAPSPATLFPLFPRSCGDFRSERPLSGKKCHSLH